MDKKTYGIGILTLMAIVLFVANFMPIRNVQAADAVKERDFTIVTSPVNQGGEALYILDNRTGQIAVFVWDVGRRQIVLRDLKGILDLFHD